MLVSNECISTEMIITKIMAGCAIALVDQCRHSLVTTQRTHGMLLGLLDQCTQLATTHAVILDRREIITVRGQSYFSRLPKY